MNATLKDGKLILELDANTTSPPLSSTKKTRIVATTSGNLKTTVVVNGKPLTVGVNAYIKAD